MLKKGDIETSQNFHKKYLSLGNFSMQEINSLDFKIINALTMEYQS